MASGGEELSGAAPSGLPLSIDLHRVQQLLDHNSHAVFKLNGDLKACQCPHCLPYCLLRMLINDM
jgi:hypothetical protein